MEASNTIPEIDEEKEVQLDSLSDVELDEMPPKRPRGRPKGKAKPKPEPKVEPAKKGRPPKLQVPPPQLDMNALTRMLAEHLAGEKQTARAKRHDSWSGFF